MRIISGKYKGRQLHSLKDQSIRPTTDKIKEYIFNLLHNSIKDALVLDLFCGTGTLGLEALSRGAKNATFIDNSQNSLRILRRNINRLKIEESYTISKKDAKAFLHQNKQPFDLIFADPPYSWKGFDSILPLIFKNQNLSEYGILVMESERLQKINWNAYNAEALKTRCFDRTVITFAAKKGII